MIKKRILIPIIILSVILLACSCYITNGLYQSSKLLTAVENNDYESAKEAVECGAWINKRRFVVYLPAIMGINTTPLIEACKNGNQEIVELLIENGADVNFEDNGTKNTPLLAAIKGTKENRFRLAMYIIEKGGDIYANQGGASVFYRALYISENDSEQNVDESVTVIKYLLEINVDHTIYMSKENALTHAAHYRNYGAVDYLIQEGYYDVNCRDDNGDTALIVSVKYNNVKTVEVLLKHGADASLCDTTGKTALDYAKENGNDEIITNQGTVL